VLFVGDGINDSLVAEAAHCAGTPAIDRSFTASRCDFYFVTPGLRPTRAALETARAHGASQFVCRAVLQGDHRHPGVRRQDDPALCAVLMPLSSLSTVMPVDTDDELEGNTPDDDARVR